jgi:hypothetical protein
MEQNFFLQKGTYIIKTSKFTAIFKINTAVRTKCSLQRCCLGWCDEGENVLKGMV